MFCIICYQTQHFDIEQPQAFGQIAYSSYRNHFRGNLEYFIGASTKGILLHFLENKPQFVPNCNEIYNTFYYIIEL